MAGGLALAAVVVPPGCGARTGLPVDDSPDASVDASVADAADAGPDVFDARPDVCVPGTDELVLPEPEIVFVIDRSNSMAFDLEGDPPIPFEPTRWDIMAGAFTRALQPFNNVLSVGVKMYPDAVENPGLPSVACAVTPGLDVRIASGNSSALAQAFQAQGPSGGTPTALAIEAARRELEKRPSDGTPRFMVVATDGAPNCNPRVPPNECVCTWVPETCADPVTGPYLCLDDRETLAAIDRTVQDGVPVYVIGISDPNPIFIDTLNRMAVAGGRPRTGSSKRYYDVSRMAELEDAFTSIVASVAECVFILKGNKLRPEDIGTVEIDGREIPRDVTRQNGWDITSEQRGEVTLFGPACERAQEPRVKIIATAACPE